MERLEFLLGKVEEVTFSPKPICIEQLHNRLQDILFYLEARQYPPSGEIIGLRSCAWILYERYYMDNEEQLLWTFHHTKHKIIRFCNGLLERSSLRNDLREEKKKEEELLVSA